MINLASELQKHADMDSIHRNKTNPLKAIIAPHGDQRFTDTVIGSSQNVLRESLQRELHSPDQSMLGTTRVKTIVVMAPWIGDKDDPASVQKGLCIPEQQAWDTPLGELHVDLDLVSQLRASSSESSTWPMGIAGVAKGEAKIPQTQVIEPQKVLFTADKQKELEEWALELQLPIIKSIADDLNIKIKIVPIQVGVIDDALLLRVDRAIRGLFYNSSITTVLVSNFMHYGKPFHNQQFDSIKDRVDINKMIKIQDEMAINKIVNIDWERLDAFLHQEDSTTSNKYGLLQQLQAFWHKEYLLDGKLLAQKQSNENDPMELGSISQASIAFNALKVSDQKEDDEVQILDALKLSNHQQRFKQK